MHGEVQTCYIHQMRTVNNLRRVDPCIDLGCLSCWVGKDQMNCRSASQSGGSAKSDTGQQARQTGLFSTRTVLKERWRSTIDMSGRGNGNKTQTKSIVLEKREALMTQSGDMYEKLISVYSTQKQ